MSGTASLCVFAIAPQDRPHRASPTAGPRTPQDFAPRRSSLAEFAARRRRKNSDPFSPAACTSEKTQPMADGATISQEIEPHPP